MKLLSIDCETGGLRPQHHSLLSVALVAYDTEKSETTASLHFYIKHPTYYVTAAALDVNKINISTLDRHGITPEKAVAEIIRWMAVIGYNDKDAYTVIGKNPGFDRGFLDHLFFKASGLDINKVISHRFIDVSSLVGLCKDLGLYPMDRSASLSSVAKYWDVDSGLVAHDAYNDCMMALHVYEHIKHEILPNFYGY